MVTKQTKIMVETVVESFTTDKEVWTLEDVQERMEGEQEGGVHRDTVERAFRKLEEMNLLEQRTRYSKYWDFLEPDGSLYEDFQEGDSVDVEEAFESYK